VYLTKQGKLATSSILIAIFTLRLLYKVTLKKNRAFEDIIPAPKKPQTLPVSLVRRTSFIFLPVLRAQRQLYEMTSTRTRTGG
jgi:hypothetical protein